MNRNRLDLPYHLEVLHLSSRILAFLSCLTIQINVRYVIFYRTLPPVVLPKHIKKWSACHWFFQEEPNLIWLLWIASIIIPKSLDNLKNGDLSILRCLYKSAMIWTMGFERSSYQYSQLTKPNISFLSQPSQVIPDMYRQKDIHAYADKYCFPMYVQRFDLGYGFIDGVNPRKPIELQYWISINWSAHRQISIGHQAWLFPQLLDHVLHHQLWHYMRSW